MPDSRRDNLLLTVSDMGRASFLGFAAYAGAVLVLEYLVPGLAANTVSPQRLAAGLALSGALSLVRPAPLVSARWRSVTFGAAAIAGALLAFSAGLRYFGTVGAASVAAFAVLLPFLAFAGSGPDRHHHE